MDKIKLTINGIPASVVKGATILEAAQTIGIRIPTLCHVKDLNNPGACRVCVVQVKGKPNFAAACVFPAEEGMEVLTNTPEIREARRSTIELILSNHRMDCLSCRRNLSCELQEIALEYGVNQHTYDFNDDFSESVVDNTSHLARDNSKCILCRRCTAMCKEQQKVGVIGTNYRGFDAQISTAFEIPLEKTSCVFCGQCINICPTGALTERDDTKVVWDAIADPSKHVVIAPAPAIRAQLGECFGMPIGTNVEKKMITALKRIGFDKVFDVSVAADITIMEEGTELLHRIEKGGPFPLITSCSPGWVKFCEHYYPDMIKNLSSCKSPQQMYGALMKTYYAENAGIDPENMVVVSVMPCVAKKFESAREEHTSSGYLDVDVSITTRELAAMIKRSGLMFEGLPDGEFDDAFGTASGAAHIFGATGGVCEAALRTVSEIVLKKPLEVLDFKGVRGVAENIKEAECDLNGLKVKVAVTSGLANARKLMEMISSGEKEYHFVEIMACPGGCVNGGGSPIQSNYVRNSLDLRAERAKALYSLDEAMTLRKSHENPVVKEIYDNFLEKPGSHKAHDLLHTTYKRRDLY